jgi:prepilin-type N-terminal cleavage/methylation domain-containing protein
MRASRQSNPPRFLDVRFAEPVGQVSDLPKGGSPTRPAQASKRAFTLVELILVLLLLAITASFVASNMGAFFRGRALSFEARRILSLTHYAQSRAVSQGVPMFLWFNPADSTYGLTFQSSYGNSDGDAHAVTYTADPSVRIEIPDGIVESLSEDQDERLGLPDGALGIRFMPDGFFDQSSVKRVIVRQGNEGALQLVPTANRLGYEIRPATNE